MLPLFRAVLVWVVILVTVVLPRLAPPAQQSVTVAVSQLTAFDRSSALQQAHAQRVQAAQMAQVQSWSQELKQGLAEYQAKQAAEAAAQAQAEAIAARNNHPAPPPEIAKDIVDAFSPLGPGAVQWAMNIAWCESRYHPNSVNSSSGASGLFQFLPSTWSGTPYASQSPFDPRANSFAAAWLYSHYGSGRWECRG
ncbi:MAG: lytic transglycosylase domain-containing protein [Chloroflexi bacterium]|nr:MAG: lytic transglycosylase domain-containing protein [Chloroflexota bacterium]TMG22952.1 MAG: lytic transglycosylase domain-containing protein [Chloroflexota bacterium]TMG64813.1 MAG: lytic transglycosylase domain-containing protein [Chloroflexota bacterium]